MATVKQDATSDVAALESGKAEIAHYDENVGNSASDSDHDHGFTKEEERRIIRRIDARLTVVVGVLYCISLMDRTNVSAANIAGMAQELVLTGIRYNVINLVFFVPYIVFQYPSTIVIRKLGPRKFLSMIVVLWGGVMIGMGFVTDHKQLAGLRTCLGFFEAGFYPSCVYLLSTWYTRYDVGKRFSVFYIIGCVAGAFAGILAYGLTQLNGQHNISGWRWIFIIEGVITVGVGVIGYWLLVDFPDSQRKTWAFLSEREIAWVIDRIQRDRGDTDVAPFNLRDFLRGGTDWHVWAHAMIFFCTATIVYALAYTMPLLLVYDMGFNVMQGQCLVAPPFAFAGIIMYATSWVGDKYKTRGPIIIFNMMLCIIGLPIMGWHPNSDVRFFGMFLTTAGAYSNLPASTAFQSNNVRGQWKRAFSSATQVMFGGIGGIAGSLTFRENTTPGMWMCIACTLVAMTLTILVDLDFRRLNRKADRGEITLEAAESGASADYRYTI